MPEQQETTFRKLMNALLELLRGYPTYRFFGKIESYLTESNSSLEVLNKDGVIEFASRKECNELNKKLSQEQWAMIKAEGKKEPVWYRLAPRGVELAISMTNLEYSEEMREYSKQALNYSEKMDKFTKILILFGASALFFTIEQVILNLIFPK